MKIYDSSDQFVDNKQKIMYYCLNNLVKVPIYKNGKNMTKDLRIQHISSLLFSIMSILCLVVAIYFSIQMICLPTNNITDNFLNMLTCLLGFIATFVLLYLSNLVDKDAQGYFNLVGKIKDKNNFSIDKITKMFPKVVLIKYNNEFKSLYFAKDEEKAKNIISVLKGDTKTSNYYFKLSFHHFYNYDMINAFENKYNGLTNAQIGIFKAEFCCEKVTFDNNDDKQKITYDIVNTKETLQELFNN